MYLQISSTEWLEAIKLSLGGCIYAVKTGGDRLADN